MVNEILPSIAAYVNNLSKRIVQYLGIYGIRLRKIFLKNTITLVPITEFA